MRHIPKYPTHPPCPEEFEARHLRRWLAQSECRERMVLEWVVRAARRLEGLPLDHWEWVTRHSEKEPYDDTAASAR